MVACYLGLLSVAGGLSDEYSNPTTTGEAGPAFLVILGVVATNAARILDWESQRFDRTTPALRALTRQARRTPQTTARPRASHKGMSASRRVPLALAPLLRAFAGSQKSGTRWQGVHFDTLSQRSARVRERPGGERGCVPRRWGARRKQEC